jgi:Flp pilus assembly CpaE family ATPase
VCITDVLGQNLPKVFFSFLDLGSASTSTSAFSSSSTGSVQLIFLDFTFGSTKLILNNILERRFTFVDVLPHTTLLAVVEQETGFATQL